jgi:hypothetical protein
LNDSGEIAPRECGVVSNVIACDNAKRLRKGALATKQSILSLRSDMDCFAEPVIGRAFARPVGSQ